MSKEYKVEESTEYRVEERKRDLTKRGRGERGQKKGREQKIGRESEEREKGEKERVGEEICCHEKRPPFFHCDWKIFQPQAAT